MTLALPDGDPPRFHLIFLVIDVDNSILTTAMSKEREQNNHRQSLECLLALLLLYDAIAFLTKALLVEGRPHGRPHVTVASFESSQLMLK
jgi:hypothetical protein